MQGQSIAMRRAALAEAAGAALDRAGGLPSARSDPAPAGRPGGAPRERELTLDALPPHRPARIVRLAAGPDADPDAVERARRLAEIGFVPGEPVAVTARAWPGGDPLVVKVGGSRFALRRAEAACVLVECAP